MDDRIAKLLCLGYSLSANEEYLFRLRLSGNIWHGESIQNIDFYCFYLD